MRVSILLGLSAACGLVVFGVGELRAQQFGGTSRSSGNSIGGGLSTTGVFGQSQVGGVSSRQQFGSSRGGNSSPSGLGSASNNPLANLGNAGSMLSGRQQQQGAFVGRGNAEDLGRFIGAANAASQGQGYGGQGGNFGGRGNQQFGANQFGRGGQYGQNGQNGDGFDNQSAEQVQELRRFRTKLSLGFQPSPAQMTAFTTASTSRLAKTLGRSVGAAVQVQFADEVVVLNGTVATSAEKLLAEQLALLEPGVARVQNDLVVAAGRPSDVRSSKSPAN